MLPSTSVPQKINQPNGPTGKQTNQKAFKTTPRTTPKREIVSKRETVSKGKVNKKNVNFYTPKKK